MVLEVADLLFDYMGNSEWKVENMTKEIIFINDSFYKFDQANFHFHLRRQPHFYIYVIVVPSSILSILSIIGMFVGPNDRQDQLTKLTIGLTSLMSITVLLDIVTSSIPKSQTFPLLGTAY
ncbi:unnamed protein product, partial [Mesorhabditis spiculigera]